MNFYPFLLVIISAISHAYWNFLVKKSEDKDLFVALSKITEVLLFLIPFTVVLIHSGIDLQYWYFILIAAFFVFLNYFFLAKSYKYIDLTIAYPISRSSTLFLPLIAYLFIGETINLIGILSVICVTLGVIIINLGDNSEKPLKSFIKTLKSPGAVFAILAALTVASYTVWDKMAIREIHPFLYFYSYTLFVAIFYFLKLVLQYKPKKLFDHWIKMKSGIIQVAFFNTFTYLLVLIALSSSKATYIGALRQLSLIFGGFLGWKYLNESLTSYRVWGISLILLGGILTLFAK